ncbi:MULTISPECIES: quinone oxidoreductase family protein [Bacillus]|uniref:NAD(P)-dependent alcohol dehydrogenase n=1 Tax=Bacillus glycinifermentans TaxID=1664069 RepID=A0AAJ3YW39_9BACI|nr:MULTISPECIES: zinc-binding dehydrogenase [Bacillus]KKB74817.1 alcohol dehydrogenase [Bacillus sp. TH008]MBU8789053.1 zinc-binding dehydrogenase [Bacillus glycinifermentans]MDU0071485.1 zinc-binding dehydrogenase [Bacillus sp. IG6]MED8019422.1 zinc-binding dehydrogenase [Bacillus glycinifermentans]NUJ18696.1 zinc-binding dehydrogenase [Bacillus glycinifermentans]
MKAIIHSGTDGLAGLKMTDAAVQSPGYGEVKIKVKAAGLNHRDIFLFRSRKEGDAPFIPGSDGAGIVEETGEGVSGLAAGAEVIINPSITWEFTDSVPQVPDILGGPSDGTFAEYVIVSAKNVLPKPAYLTWEEAGVLPLSALTAYRALFTKGRLKKGEHLFIPGIGSGVATYALLMAKAAGAQVTVTSRSEEKRKEALNHGADRAIDSSSDWNESLKGEKVDFVLDSIGPATFPKYFDILKPNGRIVNFGASSGDSIELPLRSLFFPQFSIIGTSMGSLEEFRGMLRFMERHSLRPIIDKTYPLSDARNAFNRMTKGEQFGKIALVIDA